MNPPQDGSSDPTKLTLPSLSIQFHRPSTLAVHADDHLNDTTDVAPPLHVSTTFRYASNPTDLVPHADDVRCPFFVSPTFWIKNSFNQDTLKSESHVYSRETAPNTSRLETILTSLLHAPSLTYTSGLAALHAIYVHLAPRRVSIGEGYHGSHTLLAVHTRLTSLKVLPLDCPATDLEEGDVIHLETPLNPTGEAYNIAAYAEKAHSRGAHLIVDATFGPPGLQDPFLWGADVVMHSGTKYLGGHSDMLCGVLATKRGDWWRRLHEDRAALGSVMGSLEGWLGVRSLRTLDLRVRRQSDNAERLVEWLNYSLQDGRTEEEMPVKKVIKEVKHASIQHGNEWLKKQMPNGYGPVFAIVMNEEEHARRLPSLLKCFSHATSLGGVESLIEWRTMSDKTVDRRLMRISVGVEDWKDLKDDLLRGFRELAEENNGEP